jgi:hypothetical protein
MSERSRTSKAPQRPKTAASRVPSAPILPAEHTEERHAGGGFLTPRNAKIAFALLSVAALAVGQFAPNLARQLMLF